MPTNPTRQYALVQNASTIVANPNPARKFIGFGNPDANNVQYVSNINGDGVNGFPVMPRSYIGFEITADKIDVTVQWYCFTAGAAQVINVIEGFYEKVMPVIKTPVSLRSWR